MSDQIKSYDESNIQILGVIDGIRKRPTVYIELEREGGNLKLFMEMIQNVIDEFNANRATTLDISVDTPSSRIVVADDGPGIPIDIFQEMLESMHAGGKFDNDAYEFSSGSNGLGLKVLRALSEEFIVEIRRDGKLLTAKYERGVEKSFDIVDYSGNDTGTILSIIPDASILLCSNVHPEDIHSTLNMMGYANAGLIIKLNYDGQKFDYTKTTGLPGYLDYMCKTNSIRLKTTPIEINRVSENNEYRYSLVFGFTRDNIEEDKIYSFVNNFVSKEHGTHVTAFRTALSQSITNYIKKNPDIIPKKFRKLNISGTDIQEFVIGVVLVHHKDPKYSNQTKNKLASEDLMPFMRSTIYDVFSSWCVNNIKELNTIIDMAIVNAKAKNDAKEAKEKAFKATVVKNVFKSGDTEWSKFNDCSSTDPKRRELYILEGDSAASNIAVTRDSAHQAVYRLKGKCLNVIRSKEINEVLAHLISILGCGSGSKKDMSKLRFNKIIIVADADDDGYHISSLLLGFFYKYYPEILMDGMVFLGRPPLYHVKTKKGFFNFINEDHINNFMIEVFKGRFDIVSKETRKPLSSITLDYFLYNLIEYKFILSNYRNSLMLDEELIELLILNFKSVTSKKNYKYSEFNEFGFVQSKILADDSTKKILTFDKGLNHYTIELNTNFYNTTYKPLYNFISNKLRISNILLYDKKNKRYYNLTYYALSCIIHDILNPKKNKDILYTKRFKGIGTMNEDVTAYTIMNKETRKLIQVTMDDVEDAAKNMSIFLGEGKNDILARKEYILLEDKY